MSRLEGRQGGFGDGLGARTRAGRTLPAILSDESPQGAKQIKSTKNQQKTSIIFKGRGGSFDAHQSCGQSFSGFHHAQTGRG